MPSPTVRPPAPQIGDLIEVQVEKAIAGGDGLGRDEVGRVVFVTGGIAGERVQVRLEEVRSDFTRGRVADVLVPSPERREPPCVHVADGCGGCDWQHISASGQLEQKVGILRDALRRIARIDDESIVAPIQTVEETRYRTTMRFVSNESGQLCLRKRNTEETVPIPACVIAHPLLADHLSDVVLPPQEVLIRSSATDNKTVVVRQSGDESEMPVSHVVANGSKESRRAATVFEEVAGFRWRISNESFFQSGRAAAELLTRVIIEVTERYGPQDGLRVLDCYAGVGILGGSLLRARKHARDYLVAVESNRWACADAASNLSDLRAEVIHGELADFRWRGNVPPDVVIADPGRPGLGEKISQKLVRWRPGLIVLVSCDPASMARDISLFSRSGYQLRTVIPLDFFPQTSHVEAVCVLTPVVSEGAAHN